MEGKRRAPERPRSAKRQRGAGGGALSVDTPSTGAGTGAAGRPPRMPACARDWRLVRHLNQLAGRELLALVRDVETRYRKLAAFEAQEIRRAQALGLGAHCRPLASPMQLVAL